MSYVTSKDGTRIAYDKLGSGPPLIFVAGALCYRQAPHVAGTAEVLASRFTVYNYDRRGRGDSTDTLPYAVEREVEDIGALIDAAGGSAIVCGHSSGGALAFEAALRLGAAKVTRLAMYDPPYNADEAAAAESRAFHGELERLIGAGKRGEAVTFFMTAVGMPAEMIDGIKQSPAWAQLEALAHTLLYETALVDRLAPVARARELAMPTLVMYGAESLDFMRDVAQALAKAIPRAELKAMPGGHEGDPRTLTDTLAAWAGKGG